MLRGLESSLYMAVKAWAAHTHHKPANLIIAITITKYAHCTHHLDCGHHHQALEVA